MEVNSVGKRYMAAQKQPAETQKYYVYVAKNGEEICYVGSGVFGRWDHVSSGTSHNYGLNKLHFEGVVLDVQVLSEHDCVKDARSAELVLIKHFSPTYNIKGNTNTQLDRMRESNDFLRTYKALVRKLMFGKSAGRRKLYLEMIKPTLLYYDLYDLVHGVPMADWGGGMFPTNAKGSASTISMGLHSLCRVYCNTGTSGSSLFEIFGSEDLGMSCLRIKPENLHHLIIPDRDKVFKGVSSPKHLIKGRKLNAS